MKKSSKRRRTKQEILEQAAMEARISQENSEKIQQYDQMAQEVQNARAESQHNAGAAFTIQKLLDDGILVIDEEGNFVPAQQRADMNQQE